MSLSVWLDSIQIEIFKLFTSRLLCTHRSSLWVHSNNVNSLAFIASSAIESVYICVYQNNRGQARPVDIRFFTLLYPFPFFSSYSRWLMHVVCTRAGNNDDTRPRRSHVRCGAKSIRIMSFPLRRIVCLRPSAVVQLQKCRRAASAERTGDGETLAPEPEHELAHLKKIND